MDELRQGIGRARDALQTVLKAAPVAMRERWEKIVALLDEALKYAEAANKQAALERVDEARGHLKSLAMMERGPSFELMDMENARRTALQALDRVPRTI